MIEAVGRRLGLPALEFVAEGHPALHPGRAAAGKLGDSTIVLFGELRPDVAAAAGIDVGRVCVAEFDLSTILALAPRGQTEVRVPRFLPVEQDFAVVVSESVPVANVETALRAASGPLATNVALFDIYRGTQICEGNKCLALRVTFTAPDRALTDSELVKVRGRIEKILKQRVDGSLRS